MQYIIDRLKEPSTYAGLIAIVSPLVGWVIAPEIVAQIATGAATIAGGILALTKAHGSH